MQAEKVVAYQFHGHPSPCWPVPRMKDPQASSRLCQAILQCTDVSRGGFCFCVFVFVIVFATTKHKNFTELTTEKYPSDQVPCLSQFYSVFWLLSSPSPFSFSHHGSPINSFFGSLGVAQEARVLIIIMWNLPVSCFLFLSFPGLASFGGISLEAKGCFLIMALLKG